MPRTSCSEGINWNSTIDTSIVTTIAIDVAYTCDITFVIFLINTRDVTHLQARTALLLLALLPLARCNLFGFTHYISGTVIGIRLKTMSQCSLALIAYLRFMPN